MTDPIQSLTILAAKIETQNESKETSFAAYRRKLNALHNEGIALKTQIDRECPDRWEDAPDLPTTPNAPREWFIAAKRSVDRRNARRRFIKTRLSVLRDRGLTEPDERAERITLIAEAQNIGPFENIGNDPLSTEILKQLAWHMKDDAESVSRAAGVCIECGNLAPPNSLLCMEHGTEDRVPDDMDDSDSTPLLIAYEDATGYEYSY